MKSAKSIAFLRIVTLAIMFGLLTLCGCDPVITLFQDFTISVSDRRSGMPLAGAMVAMAPEEKYTEQGQKEPLTEWVFKAPWASGTTDAKGSASMTLTTSRVTGPLDLGPDDQVTGRQFLFGISAGPHTEVLRIKMDKGIQMTEGDITVEIVSIGKSRQAR